MNTGSGKKLTRRGVLALAASGAAGFAYLESRRHPGRPPLRRRTPRQ